MPFNYWLDVLEFYFLYFYLYGKFLKSKMSPERMRASIKRKLNEKKYFHSLINFGGDFG